MNALRHGSVISQLENDRFNETEGDDIKRAYSRGWNMMADAQLRWTRAGQPGLSPMIGLVSEDQPDLQERAYYRGANHATKHVRDIFIKAGLAELAHAPVIETINEPLVDFSGETGGES